MEAKLHLYVGGNVEARLDVALFISLRCSHAGKGEGMVKHRLDRAANGEPEICLRLARSWVRAIFLQTQHFSTTEASSNTFQIKRKWDRFERRSRSNLSHFLFI